MSYVFICPLQFQGCEKDFMGISHDVCCNYTKVGTNRLSVFWKSHARDSASTTQSINIIHGGSASKLSHLDDLYWTLWPPMLQWLTHGLCIWLTRISQDSDPTLAYEILLLIHKGAGEIIEGLPTETPATKPDTFFIPKKIVSMDFSMPPAHIPNTPFLWRKVM